MSLKSARKNGKNGKNVFISAKNKQFVWFRTFISALMTLVSAVYYSSTWLPPSLILFYFIQPASLAPLLHS